MNKGWKAAALIGAILVIAGLVIGGASLMSNGFSFHKLSTVKYDTTVLEPVGSFGSIAVEVRTADVSFVPSADGKCTVTCCDDPKMKYTAEVKDGTLTVRCQETRKGAGFLNMSLEAAKVTVALPGKAYTALAVQTGTGDVSIPADFSLGDLWITTDTGDTVCRAAVAGALEYSTDTGDFRAENLRPAEAALSADTGSIELASAKVSGLVTVTGSTGRIRLTDVSCGSMQIRSGTGSVTLDRVDAEGELKITTDTGNVKLIGGDAGTLRVKTNTGDLTFDGADAGAIYAETDTGDVTGSLRTEKVFLTETETGKVSVPKTITGGRCEITTNTGDIKLSAP